MVWNPLRLLKTLVHFDVVGPLSQGIRVLSGIAYPGTSMLETLDPASWVPTLPRPGVRLVNGAVNFLEPLTATLDSLGYRIEVEPPASAPKDWMNTALVVWSGASPGESLAPLLERWELRTPYQEATLVDFRQPDPAIAALWGSLDDGVMGGVSTSQVQWHEGLRFAGQVSTANSGGFASIRTRNLEPPLNLGQWQGTILHTQGDGQRYKWILRDNPGWDSLAYCRSFDTQRDQPSTVRTPFLTMVPTRRARTVPESSPLNPAQLYSMQLMLSKFEYNGELNPTFQPGAFGLTVQSLGLYRQGPKPVVVLPGGSAAWGPPLAVAGFTGVISQGQGFEVIGASKNLPPEVTPAVVEQIFKVCHSAN